jgi:elongation factor Ts
VKALGGTLGENIQLGRVVRLEADGWMVDAYKHIQIDRGVLGVLVVLTGAGMMDCKRALQETDGDIEAAKTWLREKGLAGAQTYGATGDTVDTTVKALGGTLGENIQLGRVVRLEADGGIVDAYKHVQNDRGVIGVLVVLSGVDPSDAKAQEIAHDVALHVASAAPGWTRRDDVPPEVVEAERQVLENLTRNEGKPEEQIDKIVNGRIGGFFKDRVLVEQGFVKDPKTTIAKLVGTLGPDAQVKTFARVKIGEE